jgi:alpha-D-ribose 1-methylphosphonate 5-triphosphate synthase subunit PhnH
MQLDRVHDIQQVFRKMAAAASFPGKSVCLAEEIARVGNGLTDVPDFLLLALTLLDAEVAFAYPGASADMKQLISQMTYSTASEAADSHFVFIDKASEAAEETLLQMRRGTLMDPQLGATVFLHVVKAVETAPPEASRIETVASGKTPVPDGEGKEHFRQELLRLTLSGPGVAGSRKVFITAPVAWGSWLEARNTSVREFPLGIDLFLIDDSWNMISIPRTTIVAQKTGESGESGGQTWPM